MARRLPFTGRAAAWCVPGWADPAVSPTWADNWILHTHPQSKPWRHGSCYSCQGQDPEDEVAGNKPPRASQPWERTSHAILSFLLEERTSTGLAQRRTGRCPGSQTSRPSQESHEGRHHDCMPARKALILPCRFLHPWARHTQLCAACVALGDPADVCGGKAGSTEGVPGQTSWGEAGQPRVLCF